MQKNIAGQKWIVFAFDSTTGLAKTGDLLNITANLRLDGGSSNPVDDTNPTELEGGYYVFDLTAAETNGDMIVICPSSTTANIIVVGVPGTVWTESDFTATMKSSLNAATPAVTVSDKTGFALSSTGADLILKSSTFIQAIVAAINELATYGLTALNGIVAKAATALSTATWTSARAAKLDTLGGAGAITWTYTLTDGDTGLPISNANVWATTDIAGANIVASDETDLNGIVTFYLDAGTIYIWRQKAGYNFNNPDIEVVA
jgi:hypothetical protein